MLFLIIAFGATLFALLALGGYLLFGGQRALVARLADVGRPSIAEEPLGFKDFLALLLKPLEPLRRLLGQKGAEDLAHRLSLAGYRDPGDVDTFLNAKLLCPVVGVLLGTFVGGENWLLAVLALAVLGFFAPDLFLHYAKSRRKARIALDLPNAMDLLVMCMEAGLGLDQAMLRVSDELAKSAPALSEELSMVSREQRAGRPRVEAWRNMSDRVDLDTLRQFVGMLTQSERLGTPIARTMSQFADSLRVKRLMQAEEQAAKTPVKLVFPLVLFIFPAIWVVILGPAGFAIAEAFK
jgi:tight adherence protein C